MCMIIYHPVGAPTITWKYLRSIMMRNHDGFGIHVPAKGYVYKTLDPIAFLRFYKTLSADDEFLIHCRYATNGSVKTKNCHPFMDLDSKIVFAHNGVISVRCDKDKTDSETYFRKYLLPDVQNVLDGYPPPCMDLLNGSRLALYVPGHGYRFYGTWHNLHGVLFSQHIQGSKLYHCLHFMTFHCQKKLAS